MGCQRILFLNTDLEIGGTPTVVRELACRLNQSRTSADNFEVEVACLAPWGPVADQLRQRGVRVTCFGARGIGDWRIIPKLIAHIRARRIDTIFSFLIHANAAATVAGLACGGVRLFQSIQSTAADPRWHWRLQGVLWRAAEAMIVPSQSISSALQRRSRVPAGKIIVIPNAVDADDFPRSLVPQSNPRPRPYPIAFIGRLDPIKRIGDLLAAVARLGGLVHLHIFGYGPREQHLREETRRLNIAALVSFEGRIERPQ
ncbi:MAG TPA: glycosyltransferase, partial [Tepidisphaeraceae bacterium]